MALLITGFSNQKRRGHSRWEQEKRRFTEKSRDGVGCKDEFFFHGKFSFTLVTCSMVTDVITCRIDQGVTRMMNDMEMAERLLTKLDTFSASSLSLTGWLAREDPIIKGRAENSAFLFFIFSFCEW